MSEILLCVCVCVQTCTQPGLPTAEIVDEEFI